MSLKSIFTDVASDVADDFYPKGDKRRGEFIRDSAVMFAKLEPRVKEHYKSKKLKPISLQSTMLAEDIINYFEDVKEGIASDLAFYECLELCERLIQNRVDKIEFIKYLEFVFGFRDAKEFATLKQKSDERFKDMDKLLNGKAG